jgi:hypothetical protein
MRPPREDIAAPPFPPATAWVGGEEPNLARMVARGPLLVHFFDFAQLNSVRALPYVEAWSGRYGDHGLGTLGVHSPRFAFTRPAEAVAAVLPRLGIGWPVAVDAERRIWRDYGCEGWPSLFLWSRGGTLRWYQLGEGNYEATELAIREALEEAGAEVEWPAPIEPVRPSDAPGATVISPSPELFPGGSAEVPWSPSGDDPMLALSYEGGGAFVAAAGEGELGVRLDGARRDPVAISEAGLHAIVEHERHESHRLELEPSGGVEIHSVQFPPAPPP